MSLDALSPSDMVRESLVMLYFWDKRYRKKIRYRRWKALDRKRLESLLNKRSKESIKKRFGIFPPGSTRT